MNGLLCGMIETARTCRLLGLYLLFLGVLALGTVGIMAIFSETARVPVGFVVFGALGLSAPLFFLSLGLGALVVILRRGRKKK